MKSYLLHLKGVRVIVSDKCLGLYEIIGDFFPDAKWQRCIVHWYRNAVMHSFFQGLHYVEAVKKCKFHFFESSLCRPLLFYAADA